VEHEYERKGALKLFVAFETRTCKKNEFGNSILDGPAQSAV
jgi:hypothetical protein